MAVNVSKCAFARDSAAYRRLQASPQNVKKYSAEQPLIPPGEEIMTSIMIIEVCICHCTLHNTVALTYFFVKKEATFAHSDYKCAVFRIEALPTRFHEVGPAIS